MEATIPRDGSGVYSKPSGTTAVSGTAVASAPYNTFSDDLVTDANAARPITAGGTGATDAATALSNLGGQASDADLTAIAALGFSSTSLLRKTAANTWALTTIASNVETFLGAADYSAMRTQLGLVIGTNVQAYDADLTTWAGITPGTGWSTALSALANSTTTRTALGLAIGTDVQAYDADLSTWAGVTPGTGVTTALAVAVGSAGAFVVNGGALGTPSSGTLTNATGLPISTGVSGLGTGIATALAVNTGSAGAPVLFNGALGTPSSGTLTNATGLPISTGVSGLGTGVATFLATPSSANLISAITDETGSGSLVFATSPTLVTPTLGVASATSINKVALTAPATGSTLTIADGKTLTASNTITFTATDGSTLAIGTGGTLGTAAYKATGTSGNTVPLLDGTNTWSGAQAISATLNVNAGGAASGTITFGTSANSVLSASSASQLNINSAGYTTVEIGGTNLTKGGVAIPTISSSDTLSNKTLSSPTLSGTVGGSPTFSGTPNFSASTGFIVVSDALWRDATNTNARWAIGRSVGETSDHFNFYSYSTAAIALKMIYTTGELIGSSTGPTSVYSLGYRGAPLRSVSASTTLVLADAGGTVDAGMSAGSQTVTIPPNSSVAFPIGTAVVILSPTGASTFTIVEGSGVTLRRGDGTAATGTRTVAQASIVTLIKRDTNEWYISGVFT